MLAGSTKRFILDLKSEKKAFAKGRLKDGAGGFSTAFERMTGEVATEMAEMVIAEGSVKSLVIPFTRRLL